MKSLTIFKYVPTMCIRFIRSKTFLAELETMLQLVCQTQVETKKQLDLESRLGELRLQCKAIENELSCQKMRTMSMLPEIVDKQKTIIARNILSRKMTLYCERIGRKVFGAAYKYDVQNMRLHFCCHNFN